MAAIDELVADRVVEGVYAVAKKELRRTRNGAPYLALELVDPSGRIEARIWRDVELLDGRFAAGDAVRVLGRVERFRDRLQLDVRTVEAAEGEDPAAFSPALRRDADELDGFLEFLVGEVAHAGLSSLLGSMLADDELRRGFRSLPAAGADGHHGYAGGLHEHTVGVATLCRETAQLHPRLRADLLLDGVVLAELVHAIAGHHDRGACRTAEAAVLYHANHLDAVAATRPVGND